MSAQYVCPQCDIGEMTRGEAVRHYEKTGHIPDDSE